MSSRYDVHRDESPCPQNDPKSPRNCELVGTGIHQSIDKHLMEVHGWSQDKIDGARVAALVIGATAFTEDVIHRDIETLFMVHDGIHMFAPRKKD